MSINIKYISLLIAFVGLFAAGVLSAGHLLNVQVPCGGSQDCITIANHPSSKLFSVPIAYCGFAAYLFIIYLILSAKSKNTLRTLTIVTGLGTIISIGLFTYSKTVIEAVCIWCTVSGAAMVILFFLSIVMWKKREYAKIKPIFTAVLIAITAGALTVQTLVMKSSAEESPVSENILESISEDELVDPVKTLGQPDAPVTIVIFEDLWCLACREAHISLLNYYRANPMGVRLVIKHLPLWEVKGHETSRSAAALSEIAAEKNLFWSFVDSLHSYDKQLNTKNYFLLMENLGFNPEEIEKRLADNNDSSIKNVLRDEELAAKLGIDKTPTFIVFGKDLSPMSANMKTLPDILNSEKIISRLKLAVY